MSKLKAYPTQTHYYVPLSEEQWKRLNEIDARGDERTDVIPALENAGAVARHIEWNGHFGRNLFFAVEHEKQAKRVVSALEKLLKP